MKYPKSLLFVSFVLVATLHQVQAKPKICVKEQIVVNVDMCEDNNIEHLGCNNSGKWKKTCGKIEKEIVMSSDLKETIVRIHNVYRNTIAQGKLTNLPIAARMFKLNWDSNLSRIAELILKRCSLDHPNTGIGVPNAKNPGINAAYSMFPIKEDQDIRKVMKSHFKKWFDQHEFIDYHQLSSDYSPPGKETSHFKQLAIGLNSRIGCAMGRYSKDGWMYHMTVCVYGCKKHGGEKPYKVGKIAGEDCKCGVGTQFKYLCHQFEYENDCGDCHVDTKPIETTKPTKTTTSTYVSVLDNPCTITGKVLKWVLCLKGVITCRKRRKCIG